MNTLNELLLLTLIGKVFIFLWMQFPLYGWMDNKFLRKLHECDLCSGVWVYSIIFLIFRVDALHLLSLHYYPIVGEILSGGLVSFLVHIFTIGWKTKFESFIIE